MGLIFSIPPWPWSVSNCGTSRAGNALLAPQARNPGRHALQRPLQGLDLADVAALLAVLDRLAKREQPLLVHELLDGLLVREIPLDDIAVAAANLLGQLVSRRVQSPGVDGKRPGVLANAEHHVQDHHVLHLE